MAISSIEFPCDKTCTMSQGSLDKYSNDPPDLSQEESLCNVTHKIGKPKKKNDYKSPYLTGDSVHLLSRVTEKRFIHKKGSHVSTVPLSSSIYKANSDDFKSIKSNDKKVLKSVLTRPTDTKPAMKICTVSDVNDSDDEDFYKKTKKRSIPGNTRKCRSRVKGYDRDSEYCTDLDTHFGSSQDKLKNSTDNKRLRKAGLASKCSVKEKVKPHEVWAMLKNMNRFQFRPSPQISEDSFITKNVHPKRRNTCGKDLRVVETRCTEEFAYISRYKMDSPCYSHCSSFDKVTVIDKKQNFKMNTGFENKVPKKKKAKKQGQGSMNKSSPKPKSPVHKHNNAQAISYGNHNVEVTNNKISMGLTQHRCKENIHTISDDLGYESKTTEYDEDMIISENDTRDEISLYSVVYSDNSGSSKAAFLKQAPQRKVSAKEKSVMANIDDHVKQINGITKVTLAKFQNAETQHNANTVETVKKFTCIVPAARNNLSITPKLTRTEINRQLNKYKFPITVLGKDQLRSAIHVVNSEHPQFNGLDEKMWPFMKSWYGVERPPKPMRKQFEQPNKASRFNEIEKKRIMHSNLPKQKVKETVKLVRKHTTSPQPKIENAKIQGQLHKTKPIQQITDRMLELLYENTTLRGVEGSHKFGGIRKDKSPMRLNTSTGTQLNFNNYGDSTSTQDNYSGSTFATRNTSTTTKSFGKNHGGSISSNDNYSEVTGITRKRTHTTVKSYARKSLWAKAKWANDFIDNVMEKIGSGTYYTQTHNLSDDQNALPSDIKEEGIQTETNSSQEFVKPIIPGFDNVVPDIEIKTMNMNEVTVKHCVTNIVLHFDVIVLSKPAASAKSISSLIPVNVTKSLTRVFKSPTSILNTMLPAELCSILPKMFSQIVESGQHLTILAPSIEQTNCLSTITEVPTRMEFANVTEIVSIPSNWLSVSFLPLTSTRVRSLLNGVYREKVINICPDFRIPKLSMKYIGSIGIEDLKPKLSRVNLFDCDSNLNLPLQITKKMFANTVPQQISTVSEIQQINTCTALQPYEVINPQTIIGSKAMQLTRILESMKTLMNNFGVWIVGMSHNYVNINMKIEKLHKIPELQALTANTSNLVCHNNYSTSLNAMKIISLLPNLMDEIIIETPQRSSHLQLSVCCKENQHYQELPEKEPQQNDHSSVNINIPKKKTFGKLYRKCKSASSIMHGGKATPLTRIDDIDDFFRVLGSAKLLASVLDGQSSLKLMTLLKEMKNWTVDINAKQALLLLLLSNKKDTPNLVRYKPVILQGIAVKRITKVHELDMEIEVIETENLNGTSHRYEGISYLPASIENQDCLYEELCWIAKNTASDYQKPFNQTSERLLRSLLEKRKKLNPSYLRVMARYVGLGLLKTQGQKLSF